MENLRASNATRTDDAPALSRPQFLRGSRAVAGASCNVSRRSDGSSPRMLDARSPWAAPPQRAGRALDKRSVLDRAVCYGAPPAPEAPAPGSQSGGSSKSGFGSSRLSMQPRLSCTAPSNASSSRNPHLPEGRQQPGNPGNVRVSFGSSGGLSGQFSSSSPGLFSGWQSRSSVMSYISRNSVRTPQGSTSG